MNISQWKIGDRTFFSLEVDDRLLLVDMYHVLPQVSILGPASHRWKEDVAEEPADFTLASRGLKPGEVR